MFFDPCEIKIICTGVDVIFLGEAEPFCDYPLLDFFYDPILTSGKISGLVFLPLWETSTGSKWEHNIGQSLHLPIHYLESMLINEVDSFYKTLMQSTA